MTKIDNFCPNTLMHSIIAVEVVVKRKGGAKVEKSINVEVGINVEGRVFWKKLVHTINKINEEWRVE
jgi:hypothetical protein